MMDTCAEDADRRNGREDLAKTNRQERKTRTLRR